MILNSGAVIVKLEECIKVFSPLRLTVCGQAVCQPSWRERPFKRLLLMGGCELPCEAHLSARLSDPPHRHLVPHRAQRLCERRSGGVRRSAAHERAHSAQVSV